MTSRYLLAAAGACLLASPAAAQSAYNWTGFYVGANAGASWGDTSIDTHVAAGSSQIVIPVQDIGLINNTKSSDGNKTGFTGGATAGYNYQTGSVVLGVETDFSAFDINQQRTNTYASTVNTGIRYGVDQRVTTGWLWTLRPRIGYAVDSWMVYATGGIAVTDAKVRTQYTDNRVPPNSFNSSESKDKTGWTAGVGGEYAFSPNWTAKAEYLYADFGNVTDTSSPGSGFITVNSRASVKANIIRFGVNYKF